MASMHLRNEVRTGSSNQLKQWQEACTCAYHKEAEVSKALPCDLLRS
jgi:hypothetical protein